MVTRTAAGALVVGGEEAAFVLPLFPGTLFLISFTFTSTVFSVLFETDVSQHNVYMHYTSHHFFTRFFELIDDNALCLCIVW